jgi:hypothetical protein
MKRKKQSPLWPYLGILMCLFVLSVTAPRAWERMGRKQLQDHSRRQAALHGSEHESHVSTLPPALTPSDLEPVVDEELASREATQGELLPSSPVAEQPVERDARSAIAGPALPEAPMAEFVERSTEWTSDTPPQAAALIDQFLPPSPEFAQQVLEPLQVVHLPAERPATPDLRLPEEGPSSEEEAEATEPLSGWPLPRRLIEQLEDLADAYPGGAWAEQAALRIGELCRPGVQPQQASELLDELNELYDRNARAPLTNVAFESQFARTRYSLTRWLDVWRRAQALVATEPVTITTRTSAEDVKLCLADIDRLTRRHERGAAWREFLQLDSLHQLAAVPPTDEQRRAQARRVLDRLTSYRLSKKQREFVSSGPLAELQSQLRPWATENIPSQQMLVNLERYEASGLASDARRVANDLRGLHWSSQVEAEDAGQALETHYRNANMRVAIAAPLVNRMVPQPEPISAPVKDVIARVPVAGCSTTWTNLSVRLVPDEARIRLGLEAQGLVDSDTRATSGPATFYNEGRSTFLVRKLMVLGPRGLVVWPAVAEAENNFSYLVSLETDFDGVPLVGPLVRTIARNQHDDARGQARMETEYKVALRARNQLDNEVKPRIDNAVEDWEQKQLATLKRLKLEMEPVALATTEERIVARVRLANHEQLGAHTPRPRAPADSWLSMQLHQSAMNNVIEGLDLNGRKFTLPELFVWIAEKLDQPKLAQLDDIPDDVSLTFADQDGVRLKCEDGGIEVTFAFARMTRGRKVWRNFTVRSVYRPEAQGLEPRFVRDDVIHLDGSLRGKVEPGIRAIFSRVLSKNRDLRLLDEKMTSDPRMKDLRISQFISEDGWLGLAYSPQRDAKLTRRPR